MGIISTFEPINFRQISVKFPPNKSKKVKRKKGESKKVKMVEEGGSKII